ncbi:MAG TPA: phospholipid carrier-dependent glycosyltransferase, partial [Anaerolineae bacterium]|nr:phospholipid carrier-dependent glycosyltransferase [Anaerolineae bacterium]
MLFIALLARCTALGSFSWPDEQTWLERSAAFVLALERGDPEGTYLSDHPGVVPMWGFGAALAFRAWLEDDHAALEALADENYQGDYPAQLAAAATFTVLLTSFTVLAAYALLIPLVGRAGAALAGLLLALDPFYLTHSRIVHVDGILASTMLLSALALLLYLQRPHRRRFLFLSGLMAGLALLTKTPALFLIPLAALALGIQWLLRRLGREQWGSLGQVAGAFGLWLASAAATFWLAWPAAWTNPLFFVYRIYRASRWGAVISHGSNFFLGRVVNDPGPLFYLVVLPFRLSPLVMILLPLALLALIVAWRRRHDVRLPLVSLAFLVFFTVMVSLAAKKGDRYLLPAYLPAAVLAAWTLTVGLEGLAARLRSAQRAGWLPYAGAAGLILLISLIWLRLAPHYGAYFNPLLGGGPAAEGAFAFGQGEGLELAAQYLNRQEGADEALVVSFYPPQFRYY